MGLFSPNYDRPGPGIDKNTPPKTGLSLFVEIFVREFWQLVKLNLLFLLTCLPIVTIGAAIGAMNKVTVRMVRDIPNDVWSDYWRGFRENWKSTTVLGLLGAVLFGGGFLGLWLYEPQPILRVVTVAVLIFMSMFWLYLYPLLTSTTLSVSGAIHDALLLPILCFYHSLPACLLIFLLFMLQILFFPLSFPVLFLCGFSIPSFIASFAAWSGIRKHIVRDQEQQASSDT